MGAGLRPMWVQTLILYSHTWTLLSLEAGVDPGFGQGGPSF